MSGVLLMYVVNYISDGLFCKYVFYVYMHNEKNHSVYNPSSGHSVDTQWTASVIENYKNIKKKLIK